jgi:hypothetical protein
MARLNRENWIKTRNALVLALRALGLNNGPGSTYNVERANRIISIFWKLPKDKPNVP